MIRPDICFTESHQKHCSSSIKSLYSAHKTQKRIYPLTYCLTYKKIIYGITICRIMENQNGGTYS
ncbi:hypothetical protein BACSTE_01769 [Bacteroides stercoris ATCC 43183]|uniref:Uncharacterized protein n=1 Tax=Bacteroides stercoris ATCC 43183 TaxID=449673 RepID=B0NQW9_BACSE|nr:hypothetical protein BACSTE_01769 [Bacteroides stercoris ATCC 43183]